MSDKDAGGPAFPQEVRYIAPNGQTGSHGPCGGMTLRDYAALKILQGFCANPAVFAPNGMSGWALVNSDEDRLASYALSIADKYLKARQS